MNPVYLVVGCPGSGKTWVCEQLAEQFQYVPHDEYYNEKEYPFALIRAAQKGTKPIIGEIPFGLSEIESTLKGRGVMVNPVFIIESKKVIIDRYWEREGKLIPNGHLTRQETYLSRAREKNAFTGTSDQVMKYLRSVTPWNGQ